jgi:pimeloyl-ACP methyl ester carboxylesterase
LGPFEAIIAHSIGGAAVLNAIKKGVQTKKVVLLGVPGYITAIVHDFCAKLGLNQKANSKLMSHLNHKYHGDVERFSTTRLAAEMTIPALIIHDVDDFDVPIAYARQNHHAWKDSILLETTGLGHRKILSNKAVIEKISTFLGSLAND